MTQTSDGDQQKVVVVLGAGRSGTSTVTRGMQALGVDLGDRLKPATRKNPRGFFEDADILNINYRLRETFGFKRSGAGVGTVAPEAFQDPRLDPIFEDAVAVIRSRFAGTPLWGFKSGATLSFLPFWERVFDATEQQPAYALALRNPLAVARSRRKVSQRRGIQAISDLELLARVVPYLRRAATQPLAVLEYDRLLDAPKAELARAGWLMGLTPSPHQDADLDAFADAFVHPGLRHHRLTAAELDADTSLVPLARDAYRALASLAYRDSPAIDEAFWQQWASVEYTHGAIAPVLDHIDGIEAYFRKAPFRWARGLRAGFSRLGGRPRG